MDGRNFSMSNHDEDEGADYGVLEPLNKRPETGTSFARATDRIARRSPGRPNRMRALPPPHRVYQQG